MKKARPLRRVGSLKMAHFTGRRTRGASKKSFANFKLEWEWKVAPGGNSGLKYWLNQFPKGGWLGIEFQMIDDVKHPDAVRGNTHSSACFSDI